MTPQLTFRSDPSPARAGHLTEDQFGELLSMGAHSTDPALASAEAHLLTCEQCAAELASLQESVSLFRQASSTYADNELRRMPQISLPARSILSPALTSTYFAAAAALVLAAILPMQSLRQHTLHSAPAVSASSSDSTIESDEALLAGIDRETSASVPSPMEALADPTGSMLSNSLDPTSVQRKD